MSSVPSTSQQGNSSTSESSDKSDPLTVIHNEEQWQLHRVSPMHNLQYDTAVLREYADKIQRVIVWKINSSTEFVVVMDERALIRYTMEDSGTLMINVLTPDEQGKSKLIYAAIIMTCGIRSKVEGVTHLPYMLDRGDRDVASAVKIALRAIFECEITRYHFTEEQLLKFGFLFAEYDSFSSDEKCILRYKSPPDEPEEKMLSLSLDPIELQQLWKKICLSEKRESYQVQASYQYLQSQLMPKVKSRLTNCELLEICLPRAVVKFYGVVTVKTSRMISTMFRVLNEIGPE